MKLVLVVEDEYGHAEILRLVLEEHGFRVAFAANGRTALESLVGERPDVILSDYMMPFMTGGELGRAVRADDRWKDIPFVIQSGTTEAVVRLAFDDYDAFLPKPYDVDEMLDRLSALATSGRDATDKGTGTAG